jgi:hypothetical protein
MIRLKKMRTKGNFIVFAVNKQSISKNFHFDLLLASFAFKV